MLEKIEDIGKVADAAAKMSEILAGGVGTLYAPIHKKNMANSVAYEIEQISDALAVAKVPGKYEDGRLYLYNIPSDNRSEPPAEAHDDSAPKTNTGKTTLTDRINNRIACQEKIKQKNLEAVLGRAMKKLADLKVSKDDTIEQEWTHRFINAVSYVCAEPLQDIWATVLASKVRNPGSVSLRTLELLKNLSLQEAELFRKIIPFVFVRENDCFLWASGGILESFNIRFKDILLLDECGLIQAADTSLTFRRASRSCYDTAFHNTRDLTFFHMHPEFPRIRVRQYPLTHVGRELYRILRGEPDHDFMKAVVTYVAGHPKSCGLKITMHRHLGGDDSFAHDPAVGFVKTAPRIPTASDPVNINLADEEELSTLPSISSAIARNIIRYRSSLSHPIPSLDDLLSVPGIGEKRLEALRPYATV